MAIHIISPWMFVVKHISSYGYEYLHHSFFNQYPVWPLMIDQVFRLIAEHLCAVLFSLIYRYTER